MILLCAEKNESVIWIDPRGRQFRRTELVPIVFNRVEEWQRLLASAEGPICIQVMRTTTRVLNLERARALVLQRMRRLAARKRTRRKKKPNGGLLEES
jgi:hypothetical protein